MTSEARLRKVLAVFLAACAVGTCGAVEPAHFERMMFNNPGLEVDLSLGIWPHASVYDYDGDGPAVAGHIYAVGGDVRGVGDIAITWKRKGKLISSSAPGYSVPKSPRGGGWSGGAIAVCVPPGADRLAVHLSVKRQRPDETTSFHNVRAVEIR